MIEHNIDEVKKELEKNQGTLQDLRGFWENFVLPSIRQETLMIFASEGYGTWANLNSGYRAWKSKIAPFKTILRLSDRYFKASTVKGAEGNICVLNKNEFTWGVDENAFPGKYPLRHELGLGKMPQRPVFSLLALKMAGNMPKLLEEYWRKNV